jgi:hypothetical protein
VLLTMGLFDALGTLLVLASFIQWIRIKGYARSLSYGWTAGLFLIPLLLLGLAEDPDAVVYIIILVGLGIAIYQLIEYFFTTIYLTDRRIFRVSGILTRIVATMPLRALTDIRYDQTMLGRVLDYGHFHVESAGQEQALSAIKFVERPQRFYRIIMSEALGDVSEIPPEFLLDD